MKFLDRIRPLRPILGISAVFLPFRSDGTPDLDAFQLHLDRTCRAGLEPAVNMDTGSGPRLSPKQRVEVLRLTGRTVGRLPFVAGAMPFGHEGGLLEGYAASIHDILENGGTPIIFPSGLFAGDDVAALYRKIVAPCAVALAFELGPMFAPFGRIFDDDTFRRLLDIPILIGLKHSSLDRAKELERLEVRDKRRPGFRVYTGNDLAIDMVMYGSDYLLGLSTFEPEAFALRDRLWAAGDDRFFEVNDALQALGHVAFREPVPAYPDSAAAYLKLTGRLADPLPHPSCPRRSPGEAELLAPFARRVAEAVKKATP